MSLADRIRSRLAGLAPRRSIWVRGEDAAESRMKKLGCVVIARNLRLSMGEIDLLCLDPKAGCVIIVEVKARIRKSSSTPAPEASITGAKKRKLRTLARAVSSREQCRGKRIRIDVIAVDFAPDEPAPIALRHYQSAVGA